MKFSFGLLYNLRDDIHWRQAVINGGADWHMSGADSLQSVESSAPWQSRTGTELLLMQKNGPSLKKKNNISEQSCMKLSDTFLDKNFMGNQYDFQTGKKE